MSEFARNPNRGQTFEDTAQEALDIVIRIKDDEYEDNWDRNSSDTLKFKDVRTILTQPRVVYFQRQKEFESTNKQTGKVTRFSNYKLIVPFEQERAFEIIVAVYLQDGFSFKLNKSSHLRIVPFFQPPKKDFRKRNCLIKFRGLSDYRDFQPSEKFKALVGSLDSLNLPVIDINKEVDRKIWHDYVAALKKLIKQKEQVWKIKSVSTPYLSAKEGQSNRATFIDIVIDEGNIDRQFEMEIKSLFKENELEDYGVNDQHAFIEFKDYRETNESEQAKLRELGSEYFFELTPESISHYLSGDITFRFADESQKSELLNEIQKKLKGEYQLDFVITDRNEILIEEGEIRHVKKIVQDSYSQILSIAEDTSIALKVSFQGRANFQALAKEVEQRLTNEAASKGVQYRGKVTFLEQKQLLIVEVGAYISPQKFLDLGLTNIETIFRFGARNFRPTKKIQSLELIDNFYQIVNASKEEIDQIQTLLSQEYPQVNFTRRPTIYVYKYTPVINVKQLRDFKSDTDVKDKSEFSIVTSTLKITATDAADYEYQLQRIKKKCPDAVIETKPFKKSYYFEFVSDRPEKKDELWNTIKNKIRALTEGNVEFDLLGNSSRLFFRYFFENTEKRNGFIESVKISCQDFSNVVNYSFDNVLGRTVYELYKNATLELEKEKETVRNVRQASFVYLTPAQRTRLGEITKEFGVNASFREGIQIGTLIRKDRNKLQFLIKEEFDSLLTGNPGNRLEMDDIKQGFIKPIFPGELTNLDRMIRAMEKVTNPGELSSSFFDRWGNRLPIGYPVNKNLPNFLFDPTEARISSIDWEEEERKVIQNLNEPLLKNQKKQLEAVVKAITAKDLALIQGPPGTGKTTVIAEIIWQTLLRNPRAKILITSQTNLAVDNALERLSGKKLVRPIRIGNTEKFENEGKAYSNERIRRWLQSREESKQSNDNKDNAVSEWIDSVSRSASSVEKYSPIIEKWKKGLSAKVDVKDLFGESYFKHVNVFAATCSECGSRNFAEAFQNTFNSNSDRVNEIAFDLVIMDEASKATPPELVLPLTFGKKVVIIGDHKQLPPMIDEEDFTEALESVGAGGLISHWDRSDYKVSQFEKLFKNAPKSIVASLDTQFRMHEQIMNCISQFYKDQEELENGLICGIKQQMDIPDFQVKASRWHGIKKEPLIDPNKHAIWVNVETPETMVGTSYENEGEILAIQDVIRTLKVSDGFQAYYNYQSREEEKEIGIITYYMPQMMKIRRTLYPHLQGAQWRNFEVHKYENEFQLPFRINTVDKFQGMERNIIIISTVRSNKQFQITANGSKQIRPNTNYPKALGFAKELQRVNVGLSRAKRLLIVIGNQNHFAHKKEYAEAMRIMHCVDVKQLANLLKS